MICRPANAAAIVNTMPVRRQVFLLSFLLLPIVNDSLHVCVLSNQDAPSLIQFMANIVEKDLKRAVVSVGGWK